jgi:His/Glu/Gln/Arg/opine family amino acid ABC transporter permease subunit
MDLDPVIRNAFDLLEGGLTTLGISVAACGIALVAGTTAGIVRSSGSGPRTMLVSLPVNLLRGTPALVQMYLLYYGGPSVGITLDAFTAAVIALGLNGGAYVSECVRAAILAVPHPQVESARALGMSYALLLRRIILPQAIPVGIPSITNELIDVVKWSSLGAIIVAGEITQVAWSIVSRSYSGYAPLFLTVGLFYLSITLCLSTAGRWLENRLTQRMSRSHG